MENSGIVPWQALKWVLRYLNESLKGGLKYTRTPQIGRLFGGVCRCGLCGKCRHKEIYIRFYVYSLSYDY